MTIRLDSDYLNILVADYRGTVFWTYEACWAPNIGDTMTMLDIDGKTKFQGKVLHIEWITKEHMAGITVKVHLNVTGGSGIASTSKTTNVKQTKGKAKA